MGTWKIIKGKVSQAMDDIKSSKQDKQQTSGNQDDSDADSATINSSISDDFNDAAAQRYMHVTNIIQYTQIYISLCTI